MEVCDTGSWKEVGRLGRGKVWSWLPFECGADTAGLVVPCMYPGLAEVGEGGRKSESQNSLVADCGVNPDMEQWAHASLCHRCASPWPWL